MAQSGWFAFVGRATEDLEGCFAFFDVRGENVSKTIFA